MEEICHGLIGYFLVRFEASTINNLGLIISNHLFEI